LLAEGLVDELRLLTFPVAIGGGLKVFPDDRGKIALKLDELVRYDTGVLLQIYHPA
jgi:riboflavin biosynthesis pyrimidine reductase